jgi:hypothetical protein
VSPGDAYHDAKVKLLLRAADAGVTDCRSGGLLNDFTGKGFAGYVGDSSASRNQIDDVGVELGERLVEGGKAGGV